MSGDEDLSKEAWEARALNERRLGLLILENKSGPELAASATHLRNAAEAFAKAGWMDRRAEVNVQLGKLQASRKAYSEGAEAYEDALRFYRANNHQEAACDAARGVATTLCAADDTDKAETFAHQAVDLAEELNDHLRIADSLQVLGRIMLAQSKPIESAAATRKALKIYTDYRKGIEQALCLEQLGAAEHESGNMNEANENFEACIEKYDELARKFEISAVLSRWADLETKAKRYHEALTILERCANMHRLDHNNELLSQALRLQGTVHLKNRAIELAIDCFEQSYDLATGLGDEEGQARCRYMIGTVFTEIGDDERALQNLELARKHALKQDNQRITERVLAATVKLQRRSGLREEAIKTMHQWVKVLKGLGERTTQLRVLGSMARVHQDRGALNEAEEVFRRLVSVCRDEDEGERLYAEHGLALLLIKRGDHREALEHLERAVEGYTEKMKDPHSRIKPPVPVPYMHYQLGNCLMELGIYEEALVHFEFSKHLHGDTRSLSDSAKHQLARALVGLGNAHVKLGNNEEARASFQEAEVLCEEQGDLRATMIIRRATDGIA